MAQHKDNLAYDFEKFEQSESDEVRKKKIRVATLRPEKSGNVFGIVLACICALSILVLDVKAQSDLAAFQTNLTAAQKELDVLASENVRMETEIESRSAIKYVEDYASNILGMQKLDKSQMEYVDVRGGNTVYIPETEPGFFTKIKNAFNDFMEYLKG
jgi:cell division protein FtsB